MGSGRDVHRTGMSEAASARPVVLVFLRCYLPGYKSGGPVRTIANLVEALGDELDFRIVTCDRDATDTRPYPQIDAASGWQRIGKAKVLYLAPRQRGLSRIARILRETPHETLYLNSFFDPDFTVKPLLARRFGRAPKSRCVVAPRGEFAQGALALKPARKKAFLALVGAFGLYRDLEWQASTASEATDIRRTLGPLACNVRIATNLPEIAAPRTTLARPALTRPILASDPLRVVFLSRISPMKNLDFALEVLRRVRMPVRFDIYGPVRDEVYWARCKRLIRKLPRHVQASHHGSVEHERVRSVLAGYDLFFLPTLGENYGHAILEAFTAGVPVLISDATPWRDLEEIGIGWDLPLGNADLFAGRIDHVARLPAAVKMQMRVRAVAFAESGGTDAAALEANRKLFTCLSQP